MYSDSVWQDIPSSDASTTSYTVTGLADGTAYYFQVRAVNTVGDGAASKAAVATPGQPVITVSDDAHGYLEPETEKLISAVDDTDDVTTWRYKAIDDPTVTICDAAVFTRGAVDYTEGNPVILEDQADNGKQLCFESTFGSGSTYSSSQTIDGIVDARVIFYATREGRSEDIITAIPMTHAFPSESNHAVNFYVAPSTRLPDGETVTVTLTIGDSEQGEFVVDEAGATATEIMLTFTGSITPQGVTLRGVDNDVFDGMTTDYNIDVAVQTTAIATSEYHGLTVPALAAQNQDAQFAPGEIDDLSATPEAAAVALSWTAPDDGNADITRYQYRQATTSGTYGADAWTNIQSSDASTTTLTVRSRRAAGLAPGTYYFQVRAVNAIGNGADSNEASATLLVLDLNGDLVADIEDAKIVYYAYVPELSCEGTGAAARAQARAAVLGPLADGAAGDAALCDLLTAASTRMPDLNGDTVSNAEDAAVLYYSYALEGSLGNGADRQGIAVIKQAILEDLAAGLSVNELLVKVHEFRTQ